MGYYTDAKFVLIPPPPPLDGKRPPQVKNWGLSYMKKTTNLPANWSRFLFQWQPPSQPSKHDFSNH